MAGESTEIFIGIATIIIGALVVFVLFLVFTLVSQKRIVNLQKKLLRAEITSIEKERERVASDLHDSLGTVISSMILLNQEMHPADDESLSIKNELDQRLQSTRDQVRQIARNIIPKIYDDTNLQSLVNLIITEVDPLFKQNHIELEVHVRGEVTLTREQNLHVYRIIQEVLNNACRHSKATLFTFTTLCNDRNLLLVFNDNGIGFDHSAKQDGLGMSSIQNRVDLLGGTYNIDTGKGKGTEIMIRIPF